MTDQDELEELGEGLGLERRSMVFIPVNDAEEFFSGCTHWYVRGPFFYLHLLNRVANQSLHTPFRSVSFFKITFLLLFSSFCSSHLHTHIYI
jgi:hypothetical protein